MERVNHRHTLIDLAVERLVRGTAPHEDGSHADLAGARNVLPDAIADHHRIARSYTHELERRLEDARVRLEVAVRRRGHCGSNEAVELEMALERGEAAMAVRNQANANFSRVNRL